MPFWLKSKALAWTIQRELPADIAVSHSCMQEGDTEEEEAPLYYQVPLSRILSWNRWWQIAARALLIAYQKRFWGLVGHYLQEVVGVPLARLARVRTEWGRGRGRLLRQLRSKHRSSCWEDSSAQCTMAETESSHPTAGRRRRQKGPPAAVQAQLPRSERASDTEKEHSDDFAGEKEARQRSEPTTPVSTSSRHPYDYDALMGITRVGTKEAERFEEDLDSVEYRDATEEPASEGKKLKG